MNGPGHITTLWPSTPAELPTGTTASELLGFLAIAGLLTALAAAWLVAWRWRDLQRDGPAVRALARATGLSHRQRRFLQRLAEVGGFHSAGPLLLSRDCFDFAVACSGDRAQYAAALSTLRRRIFPTPRDLPDTS